MNKAIKMISLDTSTTSTGIAEFANGNFVGYDCIQCESDSKDYDVCAPMISKLQKMINNKKPDIVVVEMTSVSRNMQTVRNLTLILGALYGKCMEEGAYFEMLRPSEWRALIQPHTDLKPASRKRKDLKKWSQAVVKQLFDLDVNDDISDAILLGMAYVNKYTE